MILEINYEMKEIIMHITFKFNGLNLTATIGISCCMSNESMHRTAH